MKGIEIELVDEDSGGLSETAQAILHLVRQHHRVHPRDLGDLLGVHPATARKHARILKKKCLIEKVEGFWVVADGTSQVARTKNRVERLTYLLGEIGRLKSEARGLIGSISDELKE